MAPVFRICIYMTSRSKVDKMKMKLEPVSPLIKAGIQRTSLLLWRVPLSKIG